MFKYLVLVFVAAIFRNWAWGFNYGQGSCLQQRILEGRVA